MATTASTALPKVARPRPVHTRTAILGLAVVVVALFGFWASTGFNPEEFAFIAPFMIIPAVVAVLAWRFGTWSKVLTAVIGLALFVMNAPFLIPAMSRPQVFIDFTAGGAYLIGALVALAGAAAAVVKRGDLRTEATVAERRIRLATIALIVIMGLVSGVLALTGRTSATASEREGAVAATMKAFEYDAETYTVAAGAEARFVVHNSDPTWHTFTIDGIVDQGVTPGSDAVIELSGLEAGTYTIYCEPHSEVNAAGEREGMIATLKVE